jgi:hypothetical protein
MHPSIKTVLPLCAALTQIMVLSAGPASGGKSPVVPYARGAGAGGNWSISIHAGSAWRHLGRASYRGASQSGSIAIPSFVGSSQLTEPPIGFKNAPGDRSYTDGFVFQEPGTAADGSTWFWGYDDADQFSGQTLSFHASGSESIRRDDRSVLPSLQSREDLETWSPTLDFHLTPPGSLDCPFSGILLSFSAFRVSSQVRYSDFSLNQVRDDYRIDYVDSYDIGTVVPPQAPYAGTFDGPGPLILNTPSSRTITRISAGGESASLHNQVSARLRAGGISLAVGPTWEHQFEHCAVSFSCGGTFSLYRWTTEQTEALVIDQAGTRDTVRNWNDRRRGHELVVGAFARTAVTAPVGDSGWLLSGYLQAEAAPNFRVPAGPASFTIAPHGYSLGLQLGRSF